MNKLANVLRGKGRRDASTSTRAERDGAEQRASIHTDEHETVHDHLIPFGAPVTPDVAESHVKIPNSVYICTCVWLIQPEPVSL